jgi:two-component system, chemotaxis family, sensor kinase Cph1
LHAPVSRETPSLATGRTQGDAPTRFIRKETYMHNIQEPAHLTDCENEPIRIPGYIQSHGILIALQEPDLTILQISSNTMSLLGTPPEALLQQELTVLLGQAQVEQLKKGLLLPELQIINPLKLHITVQGKKLFFDGSMHRTNSFLILEMELLSTPQVYSYWESYHAFELIITKLQRIGSLTDLCQFTAEEIRKLAGFDRVMVYQFDRDWNGLVIAEDRREGVESFLDLRFPASDIPKQARELYTQNWLRLIADVDYQPVAIVPTNNPLTHTPLDLSFTALRSVSPLHIEYLRNMGIKASLCISLLKEQVLWGMIVCHHSAPRHITYETRASCELVGRIISSQLYAKEKDEGLLYEMKIKTIQTQLFHSITKEDNAFNGLMKHSQEMLDLVSAQGAVLCFEERYEELGDVPPKDMVKQLIVWLQEHASEGIFHTASLPALYEKAEQYKDVASGLLVLPISKIQGSYVLWFRPEVIKTVNWGGDPYAPVVVSEHDKRLHPRKSFEQWKETIRQTASLWKDCELTAAFELRSVLMDMVLRDIILRQTLGTWLKS